MIEQRCPHPHPDWPDAWPDKRCNALTRLWASAGQVHIECWRCHNYVTFDFRREGTLTSAST